MNSIQLRLELLEAYKDADNMEIQELSKLIILVCIYMLDKLDEIGSELQEAE